MLKVQNFICISCYMFIPLALAPRQWPTVANISNKIINYNCELY